jgi:putative SOS response-associated peptidase YedK
MCYHANKNYSETDLIEYYDLSNKHAFDDWQPYYHENGFDHFNSPVILNDNGMTYGAMSWGLIPKYAKREQVPIIRNQTLNCISEEMYDKPSFRDSLKENKGCLIPMTGFYEWRWIDAKGREKIPHYIHLKEQKIFSVAGIWSSWIDQSNDSTIFSYTVLTTKANALMEEIHNSKKRMPVILPREYEKDWLSPNLAKDDVLALCQPFNASKMDAYTISKRITSKKEPTNIPEVIEKFNYDKTTLF